LIDNLGLDAVTIGPLQVHAQQHGRPILGLRAAGTRLNIEKRAVRIHFSGKHTLELELLDLEPESVHVRFDSLDGALIALADREVKQFRRVAQAARQTIDAAHNMLELGAFLAEILGALGTIPNAGLL
jgi:hypothetical protein